MKTPDEKQSTFFPDKEADDKSGHAHRQLIGSVGLLLPPLLWLIAGWRPMDKELAWQLLDSISAYYYTGAVSIFAGALVAMAVFLFSYMGYKNKYHRRDRIAAIIAGIAAILVAVFPTGAPEGYPVLSWWIPPIGWIHYASAGILFSSFIFFAFFQFPKSKEQERQNLSLGKKVRNGIYLFCAVAMLACILWVGGAMFIHAPIFWPEALALEFFAISWLVKGRIDQTATAAGRQTLQYVRHPRRMVEDVKRAMSR